jgi:hypothetical protein
MTGRSSGTPRGLDKMITIAHNAPKHARVILRIWQMTLRSCVHLGAVCMYMFLRHHAPMSNSSTVLCCSSSLRQ